MNTASLELSKKLYELSGWETRRTHPEQHIRIMQKLTTEEIPAYDLGYLLRKLPVDGDGRFTGVSSSVDGQWEAEYSSDRSTDTIYKIADTPENALCSLTIELFKSGVLTREQQ